MAEHMPRHNEDLYPEEAEAGRNLDIHYENEADYFKEAVRLREKYKAQINILVGFECDWIRPESLDLIQESLRKYAFDFFVGSVHHVHTIPIDYSLELYHKARDVAGGTDEGLFEDYFDAQLGMLKALKPPVVGHFDLIRLKSDDPNQSFQRMLGVWEKVLRNLAFVASYDGILEINCASLRKGMTEPYPQAEICKAFLARSGKFCLSDDSHGVEQVALNYHQLHSFLQKTGIRTLHYLTHAQERPPNTFREDFPHCVVAAVDVNELNNHAFWSS